MFFLFISDFLIWYPSMPEFYSQAPDFPEGVPASGYYNRVLQQLIQILGCGKKSSTGNISMK
jgi:hypothetical protein